MDLREKSLQFAERVNVINQKLRNNYDKDEHYFDNCSILQYPDAVKYVIRGRHHDFVVSFDHEPTDQEINNELVYRFNMNSSYLM